MIHAQVASLEDSQGTNGTRVLEALTILWQHFVRLKKKFGLGLQSTGSPRTILSYFFTLLSTKFNSNLPY
jgi:hypothetical protein